jgi:hypothetical protein
MALGRKTGLRCPKCHNRVAPSVLLFRTGNQCARCGSPLLVSLVYGRGLVLLSASLGFFLLWIAGVRNPLFFPMLWAPTWLLILTVALPVAPFLVAPTLVAHRQGPITTLGLGDSPENR